MTEIPGCLKGTSINSLEKVDLLRKSFVINAELELGAPGGEFIEVPFFDSGKSTHCHAVDS